MAFLNDDKSDLRRRLLMLMGDIGKGLHIQNIEKGGGSEKERKGGLMI